MSVTKLDYLQGVRRRELDPNVSSPIFREFVAWIDKETESETVAHYIRHCNTLAALCRANIEVAGEVCETGLFGALSRFLITKGVRCRETKGDLRSPLSLETASFDFVFSLEVLEHIKDQAEATFDDVVLFRETGVRCYVAEMRRILKPGGILLLTTPNPCGFHSMQQAVTFQPPMVFRPHVREYTKTEILELFSGMELISYESQFSFFLLEQVSRSRIASEFQTLGWPVDERGDDHLFIFRKASG